MCLFLSDGLISASTKPTASTLDLFCPDKKTSAPSDANSFATSAQSSLRRRTRLHVVPSELASYSSYPPFSASVSILTTCEDAVLDFSGQLSELSLSIFILAPRDSWLDCAFTIQVYGFRLLQRHSGLPALEIRLPDPAAALRHAGSPGVSGGAL